MQPPPAQHAVQQSILSHPLLPRTAEQDLHRVTVDYEALPGWKTTTAGLTTFSALPPNAQAYVRRIEQLVAVPSE